jgi:hypothetical protein
MGTPTKEELEQRLEQAIARVNELEAAERDRTDNGEQDHYAESECAHLALAKILNLATLRATVSAAEVIDAISTSQVDVGRLNALAVGR